MVSDAADDRAVRLTLPGEAGAADLAILTAGLMSYNEAAWPADRSDRSLVVLAHGGEGRLIGGIDGFTRWGWFSIVTLFVAEDFRRHGVGGRLLREAEQEAVRRGCHAAVVDSFSFQAPGFYLRCGYEEFGRLEDFPPGQTRHYLKKSLRGKAC